MKSHNQASHATASTPRMKAGVRFYKMKRLMQIAVLMLGAATLTGCASTKAYFVDRGRDAADIITVGLGSGVGAKVRAGPFRAGLLWNQDWAGLRGGDLHWWPEGEYACSMPYSCEFDCMLISGDFFRSKRGNERHKQYVAGGQYLFATVMPTADRTRSEWYYYTQLEVSGGALLTCRLGLNPGELIDFILGWTTIDIFSDDLEARQLRNKSNQPAHATGKPAPDR